MGDVYVMKIPIVMLTCNTSEFAKKAVETIRRFTHCDYELILVDNGSDPQHKKTLKRIDNISKRIVNEKNIGFSAGNNQGIRHALVGDSDYICLVNDDIQVEENWLTKMKECMDRTGAGIVGPVTNYGGKPFQQLPYYENKRPMNDIKTDFVAFFCLLLKREMVKRVGYLDEIFGIGNFEDNDYCVRSMLAGYPIYIDGKTVIYHHGEAAYSQIAGWRDVFNKNKQIFKTKWREEIAAGEVADGE